MLARCLTFVALLALAPFVSAQGMVEKYVQGTHYFPINPAQPTSSGGKVEVVEVFSYACIHCAHFQPLVDSWKKTMPKDAAFVYMPALFQPIFALYGRAYYTAEVLGVSEKAHADLFKAIFVDQKNMRSLDEIAQFYVPYGVKADRKSTRLNSSHRN